jgi:hypothetical protein
VDISFTHNLIITVRKISLAHKTMHVLYLNRERHLASSFYTKFIEKKEAERRSSRLSTHAVTLLNAPLYKKYGMQQMHTGCKTGIGKTEYRKL